MMDEPESTEHTATFSLRSENVLKALPYLRDIFALIDELEKESDRGKVLISCSLLDQTLKDILLSFMVKSDQANRLVDGFNAPLGTFATRVTATYALGLISDDEFRECDIIRKIRNRFAHEIYVSFDDDQIKDLVNNLKFFGLRHDGREHTVSEKYVSAVSGIIFWISHRTITTSQERRKKLADTFDVAEEASPEAVHAAFNRT